MQLWNHIVYQLGAVKNLAFGHGEISRDIIANRPSIIWSFAALFLGNLIFAWLDYTSYPLDVELGYIPATLARWEYVGALFTSSLLLILAEFLFLILMARPFGYAHRFWHGIVAFNWQSLAFTVAALPLITVSLATGYEGVLADSAGIMLLIFILLMLYAMYNATRRVLMVSVAKTLFLFLVSLIIVFVLTAWTNDALGIAYFGESAQTPNQSSMNLR